MNTKMDFEKEAELSMTSLVALGMSTLNPTKGDTGLLGIREAVPVALRRIGVLIAALSNPEALHPCVSEDTLKETVVNELSEIEAILEMIEAEAETLAEAAHQTPEAAQ